MSPVQFHSREEVLAHWSTLLGRTKKPAFSQQDLDMVLTLHPQQKYVVSLATLADCKALCALGDEFSKTHSSLYQEEYPDVDHRSWCRYLGITPDKTERHQVMEQTVRENLAQASRFNSQCLCHSGCILKCEFFATALTNGRHATSERESDFAHRPGAYVSSSSSSNAIPSVSMDAATTSEVVGYIQFSMEEGTAPEAARFSKRLKRKRGECTGEYTKVSHLVVTQAHRKRGIGALLLAAALHRVQRLDPGYAREIFLTVVGRNEAAVGLYQRLGFSVIGRNVTFLLRSGERGRHRPIEWYQMDIEQVQVPETEVLNVNVALSEGASRRRRVNGAGHNRQPIHVPKARRLGTSGMFATFS